MKMKKYIVFYTVEFKFKTKVLHQGFSTKKSATTFKKKVLTLDHCIDSVAGEFKDWQKS